MEERNYLSDTAKEMLSNISLSLPDEVMSGIYAALDRVREELDLEPEELNIINFGGRSDPSLYLITKQDIDVGVIYANEFGVKEVSISSEAKAEIEAKRELLNIGKDDIPIEKEALKNAIEIPYDDEPYRFFIDEKGIFAVPKDNVVIHGSTNEPLPELRLSENAKDFNSRDIIDGINGDIGKLPKELKIQQAKFEAKETIDEIKEAGKGVVDKAKESLSHSIFAQRRAAKENYKESVQKIESLYDELHKERHIARLNGFPKENCDRIDEIAKAIKEETINAVKAKEKIPSFTGHVKDAMNKATTHAYSKIKANLDIKIQAGKNSLGKIKQILRDANEKFRTGIDTKYTGVMEKVEQVERDFRAVDYKINRGTENAYRAIYNVVDKEYSRRNEIKGALKDLGRAIMGKEREHSPAEYTQNQSKMLQYLEDKINEYAGYANKDIERYNESLSRSEVSIQNMQDSRKNVGLDFSKSLDENIKNAKERAAKSGLEHREEQHKAPKVKDNDAR